MEKPPSPFSAKPEMSEELRAHAAEAADPNTDPRRLREIYVRAESEARARRDTSHWRKIASLCVENPNAALDLIIDGLKKHNRKAGANPALALHALEHGIVGLYSELKQRRALAGFLASGASPQMLASMWRLAMEDEKPDLFALSEGAGNLKAPESLVVEARAFGNDVETLGDKGLSCLEGYLCRKDVSAEERLETFGRLVDAQNDAVGVFSGKIGIRMLQSADLDGVPFDAVLLRTVVRGIDRMLAQDGDLTELEEVIEILKDWEQDRAESKKWRKAVSGLGKEDIRSAVEILKRIVDRCYERRLERIRYVFHDEFHQDQWGAEVSRQGDDVVIRVGDHESVFPIQKSDEVALELETMRETGASRTRLKKYLKIP